MPDLLEDIQEFLDVLANECDAEEGPDHCDACKAWSLADRLSDFAENVAKQDTTLTPVGFVVAFESEQALQRVSYLIHRDLARTLGNIQIAQERLVEAQQTRNSLPGNQRRKAVQVLATAPEQAQVLRGAQEAVQSALRAARNQGRIG